MNISEKIFYGILVLLIFAFLNVKNIYAEEKTNNTLDFFIKEAVENNPKIQKAYHKWKAAEYKIKNVKGLPDPNLNYGYFGESVETKVGPQEQKFGASQKIPFPGKLRYKGKIQSKEAEILKEKYESSKNEVIKEVKFVFYDLYWLDKALEINNEEKSILEDMEKVAQKKYETELSSQQSVIKIQVELSEIIKKIALINQNRKSIVAKMNSILNRSKDTPVDAIKIIKIKDISYSLDDAVDTAKRFRQELIAADLSVEKSEFAKSLAKMDFLPDFTVGYEYIDIGGGTTSLADDGKDAWMGTVSVSLPLWFNSIKSGIKAKEEELKAAKSEFADVESSVEYEVQDIYFKITTYKEIVSLYETALMPQAQQAFESSQTGFETGSVSFIDWLDTQRTYLQTRLAYYKAIVDYQKAVAFLERIIGKELGGDNEK